MALESTKTAYQLRCQSRARGLMLFVLRPLVGHFYILYNFCDEGVIYKEFSFVFASLRKQSPLFWGRFCPPTVGLAVCRRCVLLCSIVIGWVLARQQHDCGRPAFVNFNLSSATLAPLKLCRRGQPRLLTFSSNQIVSSFRVSEK
ncbi:conserved hypothetical protein [Trichinella spiralis]|uniref:hypothetical protein n=1 Tax=Trichinella spiralis TaxID=6334 RepID=UPI0001EFC713|nr:conserved hypothetical protein [Trichinella spiralis]